MKKVTVAQSGTASSVGRRAERVSWFQCFVLSTSTTSTTEVGELKRHWYAEIIQQLHCVHILTVSCSAVTQGEPTVTAMHRGAGSRCPVSTAHGQTTQSAPHTWPPTTGARRKYVCSMQTRSQEVNINILMSLWVLLLNWISRKYTFTRVPLV